MVGQVIITNRQSLLRVPRDLITKGVRLALAASRARQASVVVVDDAEIRRLHRTYLHLDSPTDVLAFPMGDPDLVGEIVVSAETARREAASRGLPPTFELVLYAVHGALHLAGERDKSARQASRMRAAERAVLEKIGIHREMW